MNRHSIHLLRSHRPEVMAVGHAPNGLIRRTGPRYLAVGPHGIEPISVGEDVLTLTTLDGSRYVCTTYDNRVLVVGVDGAVERTLRAPRKN